MRFVLAILAALSMSSAAFAEEYEKGPNGGLMLDVAGVDAELMTSGNTVTFNICSSVPSTPTNRIRINSGARTSLKASPTVSAVALPRTWLNWSW